jgi:hypothetical protein
VSGDYAAVWPRSGGDDVEVGVDLVHQSGEGRQDVLVAYATRLLTAIVDNYRRELANLGR